MFFLSGDINLSPSFLTSRRNNHYDATPGVQITDMVTNYLVGGAPTIAANPSIRAAINPTGYHLTSYCRSSNFRVLRFSRICDSGTFYEV